MYLLNNRRFCQSSVYQLNTVNQQVESVIRYQFAVYDANGQTRFCFPCALTNICSSLLKGLMRSTYGDQLA